MLDFSNTTKDQVSLSIPFLKKISNDILGTSYDVSIVVIGEKRARALNEQYRGKSYVPNVLSFPIDESMGEIFLNPKTAKLEAPKFNLTTDQYLNYLIIHSMLHLKGFDHSDEMSAKENFYMKKYFGVTIPE